MRCGFCLCAARSAYALVHPETPLHCQLYPPYRTRDRLKFLAGTEIGAGMFAMDVLPETTAYELQQVDVVLEETT